MGLGSSHGNGCSGSELNWRLFPAKQGGTGHRGRFREAQHFQECWSDVRKNSIGHFELIRVWCYVEAVNEVGGVGGMG